METVVVFEFTFDVQTHYWAWCAVNEDGVGFRRVAWTEPGGRGEIEMRHKDADGNVWELKDNWFATTPHTEVLRFQRIGD